MVQKQNLKHIKMTEITNMEVEAEEKANCIIEELNQLSSDADTLKVHSTIEKGLLDYHNDQMNKLWYDVSESTPITYLTGDWDGKMSDKVLAVDNDGQFFICVVYEGVMNGSKFLDWFDQSDFELVNIIKWSYLKDLLPVKKNG